MKYISKIIIDNFQSHEHTELEFEPGLNIIIGQSDKGKSAILRALKWVLYNEPRGTDFIRYGTNECTVTIITGDNYTVIRKRKTNKNIYIVIRPDGEKLEFENFGNDVPIEVIEATGIKKVKLDTDTEAKLNLNEQLDPPFLLSETGTMRAKAIGRIVNTNIIDAAERDILKDISNNNLVAKGLDKQLEDIDEELKQYVDIEKQEKAIQMIESLYEKLSAVSLKVEKLKDYQNRVDTIAKEIDSNNQLLKKVSILPHLVDLYNDVKEKTGYSQLLLNYKNKLANVSLGILKDNEIVEKVKNIEIIENNFYNITKKVSSLDKLSELNEKHNDIKNKITKGKEYTAVVINELRNKISEYSNNLKLLGKCPTCYNMINEQTLKQIINELEGEINGNN